MLRCAKRGRFERFAALRKCDDLIASSHMPQLQERRNYRCQNNGERAERPDCRHPLSVHGSTVCSTAPPVPSGKDNSSVSGVARGSAIWKNLNGEEIKANWGFVS